MAGFFGGFFNYNKPGKGVDADEPVKRAPVRFFELFWRNFGKMVLISLVYFMILSPLVCAFHLFVFDPVFSEYLYNYEIKSDETAEAPATETPVDEAEPTVGNAPILMVFSPIIGVSFPLFLGLIIVSAIAQGPITCGVTYCLRNAARDEHFWLSDVFHRARMNLKQGLALSVIDFAIIGLGMFNLTLFFTGAEGVPEVGGLTVVGSLVALILYLGVRSTLYLIVVTFNLSVFQAVKNSLIFLVVGLPRQLLTLLISFVFVVLLLFVSGVLELVLLPLIGFVFLGWTAMFINYPTVYKYMIKPQLEPQPEKEVSAK